MPVDHQSTLSQALSTGLRRRLGQRARRALGRVGGSYAGRGAREAEMAATLARLQAELDHVSKRHGEQIERLEDLVRELIATAESLRRRIDGGSAPDEG